MKEPYKRGLANHLGPQSCAADRKVVVEALAASYLSWPPSGFASQLSRAVGSSWTNLLRGKT